MKDIAAKAGLSIAAVSLALRDHPRIPEETRLRVKRIAERLGYAPDPALSALVAHRSRMRVLRDFSVIGLVSNWSTPTAWSALPSAAQAMQGAIHRGRELGYTVQHLWTGSHGTSPGRFSTILKNRGIRGLILAPLENPEMSLDLDWTAFSAVSIERADHYPKVHHVVPNHYADLLLCWKKLRALGYNRVGLAVRQDLAARFSHQWEAAHDYARSRAPTPLEPVPILELHPHRQLEQIRHWIRTHRPQAVIGRCDNFSAAAAAEGLSVPRDIGYVSLNIVDDEPGCTGIDQHRDIMGALAIDVLNGLMQRNQRGFQPASIGTQVDGSWREGKTLSRRVPDLPERRTRRKPITPQA